MARYAIRGLDLAGDSTEDLVRFLMVAQDHDVTVRLTRARGPNGYPVANLYSFTRFDMAGILNVYCDGDSRAVEDLQGMIVQLAD